MRSIRNRRRRFRGRNELIRDVFLISEFKMDGIKKRFNKALREFAIDRLIKESDTVIVGFSGGADSRVLLSLMTEYAHNLGKKVLCAHVNHMIRGEEANRDENNCVTWAKECGVPIKVCRIDVPAIAEREGKGIEETARDERYKFFEKVASEAEGKSIIATAHNADDNLETVIFNLIRGSGTRGMAGIPPVRDGKYVRPLILCSSSLIREYCLENGITYNVDITNLDTEYTRNYIRNSIVPLLENISRDPADAAIRMCSVLRTDEEFISSLADGYIIEHGKGPQALSSMRSLHDALLSRVIDRLYRSAGGARSLSKTHVDSIIDAVKRKEGVVYISLPDGIRFCRSGNTVDFVKGSVIIEGIDGIIPLIVDGDPFVFGDFALTASTFPSQTIVYDGNIYNLSIHKLTKFDKIKCDFQVRGRSPGDTYRFGGMTRKVKKLFCDKKIPAEKRGSVPLVTDNDGIVWIPGFPLRDGVSPEPQCNDPGVSLCFYVKNVK